MSQFVIYNEFTGLYSLSLNKEDIKPPDKSFLLTVWTKNQQDKLKNV